MKISPRNADLYVSSRTVNSEYLLLKPLLGQQHNVQYALVGPMETLWYIKCYISLSCFHFHKEVHESILLFTSINQKKKNACLMFHSCFWPLEKITTHIISKKINLFTVTTLLSTLR